MNIVLATDDNYIQHCAVTIVSILENNPKGVNIYILHEGLCENSIHILEDEVHPYDSELQFVYVDKNIIDAFPMPKQGHLSHISRATYYRLLMADIMPPEVEKVIYLDCDLVVNDKLDDFWAIDITGYSIAGCVQIGAGCEALRLGYPQKYGYINAGVLLINLSYWREINASKLLVEYLAAHYDKIIFHDQDALNANFYDKCLHIDQRWNMNNGTFGDIDVRCDKEGNVIVNNYDAEKANIRRYQENPSILHYSARIKPWDSRCTHPKLDLYYDYAHRTLHYRTIPYPSTFTKKYAIFRMKAIAVGVKIKHFILSKL